MEKSARESQNSTPPSAAAKCWARLVWNESPVSQVPSLVILKSATVSHPNTPVYVSLKIPAYKNYKGYRNPLLPILWED